MTTVLNAESAEALGTSAPGKTQVRVALLGLGNVGSAIASLARQQAERRHQFPIVSALVRDAGRRRPADAAGITLTVDPDAIFESRPDVVVEVLGGLEPARTIVKTALERRIPVVTANKSLLAAHGDELFETAAVYDVPLFYEASVLAGVPFMGTFARRPIARDCTGVSGIVNGTSNFILSRMLADRGSFADALAAAQRSGYAEPNPAKDVDGDDAVEKLCVLLRHLGGWSIAPADVERTGIGGMDVQDLQQAVALGGRVRPVIAADWAGGCVTAFAGPAFVPVSNGLAFVGGVQNAVSLTTRWTGTLSFSGPGAGPAITAATILDDVVEACEAGSGRLVRAHARSGRCAPPTTGWFVRVTFRAEAGEHDCPSLLSGLGVRMQRSSPLIPSSKGKRQWLVTHPCTREHLGAAFDVLSARYGCDVSAIRLLE